MTERHSERLCMPSMEGGSESLSRIAAGCYDGVLIYAAQGCIALTRDCSNYFWGLPCVSRCALPKTWFLAGLFGIPEEAQYWNLLYLSK